MAEKLGDCNDSLSQKRPWKSCLDSDGPHYRSPNGETFEPSLPIAKKARNDENLAEKMPVVERSENDSPSSRSPVTDVNIGEAGSGEGSAQGPPTPVSLSMGDERGSAENLDLSLNDSSNGNHDNSNEDADDDLDNVSEMSGMSSLSIEGSGWRPVSGPISWVHQQMSVGADPRTLLKQLLPRDTMIPDDIDQLMLWKLIINIVSEPPKRRKLKDLNTIDDAVELILKCKKIVVLTGAGVSVSCGIPDFRSRDGIYARLAVEYPDLPDPQAMFDIHYFKGNPRPFYKFAKEIYPGQFEPSKSHKFIKLIESHGKLLRNYTQNIDTLEQVAGINNIIQCHGSFAKATCMICKYQTDAEAIREDIMNQIIPRCPRCPPDDPLAVMKPDIVFFGESLSNEFHNQMEEDRDVCDLLIVIGSSLKVRPVALIPNSIPAHVPQILINREPLRHLNFDVELLGDGDLIVQELGRRLGPSWAGLAGPGYEDARQVLRDELSTPGTSPARDEDGTTGAQASTSSDGGSLQPGGKTCSEERTASSQDVAGSSPKPDVPMSQRDDKLSSSSGSSATDQTAESQDKYAPISQSVSSVQNKESSCTDTAKSETKTDVSESFAKESSSVEGDSAQEKDSRVSSAMNTTETACTNCGDNKAANRTTGTTGSLEDPDSTADHGSTSQTPSCALDDDPSASPSASQPSLSELEQLRACWQPRITNLGAKVKDGTFLFLPPNRYVFKGAEVYENYADSDSDDSSVSSSSSSDREDDFLEGEGTEGERGLGEGVEGEDRPADTEEDKKDDVQTYPTINGDILDTSPQQSKPDTDAP